MRRMISLISMLMRWPVGAFALDATAVRVLHVAPTNTLHADRKVMSLQPRNPATGAAVRGGNVKGKPRLTVTMQVKVMWPRSLSAL